MGTLERITGNVGNAFISIESVIADAKTAMGLLHTLGWQSPPGIDDLGLAVVDISNLVDKLESVIYVSPEVSADSSGMIVRYGELLVAVGQTIKDVEDAVNHLQALLGSDYLNKTDILARFMPRLLEYVVASYISTRYQTLYAILRILGIIESTHYPKDDSIYQSDHVRLEIRFDRLPKFFSSDIKTLPQDIYGWGTTSFDYQKLLGNFNLLFQALGAQTQYGFISAPDEAALLGRSLTPGELSHPIPQVYLPLLKGLGWDFTEIGILMYGIRQSTGTATDGGIGIMPVIQADITQVFPLSDTQPWTLEIETQFQLKNGIIIKLLPNTSPVFDTNLFNNKNSVDNDASITLKLAYGDDTHPVTLISVSDDLQLTCNKLYVKGGVAYDGNFEPSLEFGLQKGVLAIGGGNGDGFLSKILPDGGFKLDFDIAAGWSKKRGVYFSGSGGLEINLPTHISLGPIELESLTISFLPKDGAFPIQAGADIKASLGPLVAVVQNMGITATFKFPDDHKGNLGFVDVSLGFKPPNGVGLSIDTGVISGGGFLSLNFDKGEYFGALELEFKDLFSLKAVGIINTKMPDGSDGFSLLIIITADFTPIQLGFGFTLNGVGGLLGLNRTTVVDVLRQGVKTNALQSVLFPQDVVANIDRIVSDLKQIFPVYEGHFIIGPMAELGWASIITLEIGILIEIPAPRIVILGIIKAMLPDEDAPLLKIQINFLGVIDFENKYISFDASLYDSSLLVFTLTGDMAFRLSWGDHPFFLLSVGGFHPAFKDAPPDLQHMARLGISLLSNDVLRVSVTCYFAVTSNTVQFGAKIELYAGVSAFNVYGYLGFDVLFQFDPFKFIADIYAGLALRSGTSVLMGISLSGELSGPTPWNIKGEASFTILFFTISVHVDKTWGDDGKKKPRQQADILQLLNDAINDNSNWRADIPDNNSQHVSIRNVTPPADELVIHPFGILTFSQRIVPLSIDITRFGNQVPKDARHFDIAASDAGMVTADTQEQFAAANFFDLKDADKLSHPSFEPMKSGFKITGNSTLVTPPNLVDKDVDYRLTYLRTHQPILRKVPGVYKYPKAQFKSNLNGGAVAKSNLSYANNRVSSNAPDPVTVSDPSFAIANVSDMKLHDAGLVAGSYREASQQYQTLINSRPDLEGQVQIVNHYELNLN